MGELASRVRGLQAITPPASGWTWVVAGLLGALGLGACAVALSHSRGADTARCWSDEQYRASARNDTRNQRKRCENFTPRSRENFSARNRAGSENAGRE